jgi:hypothetical protein
MPLEYSMEKECSCTHLSKKKISPDRVMNNFNILAITKSDNSNYPEDGEFTSLLKCKKCNGYYLIDIHNSLYHDQDSVSIIKYSPIINEDKLVKIINNLEGIITNTELDEYSKLRKIITQVLEKNREQEIKPYENLN